MVDKDANGIGLHGSDWTGKVSILVIGVQFQKLLYKV